jgi:hypothetical protein
VDSPVFPLIAVWGALATAVALTYLLLSGAAAGAVRLLDRHRRPVSRPGENIRHALKLTNGRLHRHGTAMLLAGVSFMLLAGFGDRDWWPELSLRVWVVCILGLLVPQVYGVIKFVQLAAYRRRLVQLLRLHEGLAARLAEAQRRGYRVHYAVSVAGACIDAVATGPNGIYALHIVAPPRGSHAAQLRSDGLQFQPGEQLRSVGLTARTVADLQREIGTATGVRALVQPVLVVPGCRINRGDDTSTLVVNLEACVSFVGWRNPDAFLMDDELRRIDEWLAQQTVLRDRAARSAAAESLGEVIRRPALI